MRTRIDPHRIRFPAPRPTVEDDVIDGVFDEEEDAPGNEYIVMCQERELPALQEHLNGLRELGSRAMS